MKSLTSKLVRIVAATLILCLVSNDFLYAASDAVTAMRPAIDKAPFSLEYPSSVATVRDIYHRGKQPFIVHIQDAHANLSAQKNIAEILKPLIEREKIEVVFSEGGTKDDSLTFLRPLASSEQRERVAKKYLMNGEINGAEYLNLASDLRMKILGIEEATLYRQNLEAYVAAAQSRSKTLTYLDEILKRTSSLKRDFYPEFLLKLDAATAGFETMNAGFTDYYDAVSESARRANVSTLVYPNFILLKNLKDAESKIDFNKANEEQAKLLGNTEVLEKMKKGTKDILPALESQNLDAYPNLFLYREYLRLYEKMDAEALLDELHTIIDSIFTNSLENPSALYLHEIESYIRHLKTLFSLEISSEEFERYASQKSETRFDHIVFLAFLNRELFESGRADQILFYKPLIEENAKQVEEFYRLAKKRDEVFVKKISEAIANEKIERCAVITGGYHTANLMCLLKEKNYSYAVVSPRVLNETNRDAYEKGLFSELDTHDSAISRLLAMERQMDPVIPRIGQDLIKELVPSQFLPQDKQAVGGRLSEFSWRRFFVGTASLLGTIVLLTIIHFQHKSDELSAYYQSKQLVDTYVSASYADETQLYDAGVYLNKLTEEHQNEILEQTYQKARRDAMSGNSTRYDRATVFFEHTYLGNNKRPQEYRDRLEAEFSDADIMERHLKYNKPDVQSRKDGARLATAQLIRSNRRQKRVSNLSVEKSHGRLDYEDDRWFADIMIRRSDSRLKDAGYGHQDKDDRWRVTREEIKKIHRRYKRATNPRTKSKYEELIFDTQMRWAVKIAFRYVYRTRKSDRFNHLTFSDFLTAGIEYARNRLEGYDPEYALGTYLTRPLRWGMSRLLSARGRYELRLDGNEKNLAFQSRHVDETLSDVQKAIVIEDLKYLSESEAEIADLYYGLRGPAKSLMQIEELYEGIWTVHEIETQAQQILEKIVRIQTETNPVPPKDFDPHSLATIRIAKDLLSRPEKISELGISERNTQILHDYYFSKPGENTKTQLGKKYQVDRQRIDQIIQAGITRIRNYHSRLWQNFTVSTGITEEMIFRAYHTDPVSRNFMFADALSKITGKKIPQTITDMALAHYNLLNAARPLLFYPNQGQSQTTSSSKALDEKNILHYVRNKEDGITSWDEIADHFGVSEGYVRSKLHVERLEVIQKDARSRFNLPESSSNIIPLIFSDRTTALRVRRLLQAIEGTNNETRKNHLGLATYSEIAEAIGVTFKHRTNRRQEVFGSLPMEQILQDVSTNRRILNRVRIPDRIQLGIANEVRSIDSIDERQFVNGLSRASDIHSHKMAEELGVTHHHMKKRIREILKYLDYDWFNTNLLALGLPVIKASSELIKPTIKLRRVQSEIVRFLQKKQDYLSTDQIITGLYPEYAKAGADQRKIWRRPVHVALPALVKLSILNKKDDTYSINPEFDTNALVLSDSGARLAHYNVHHQRIFPHLKQEVDKPGTEMPDAKRVLSVAAESLSSNFTNWRTFEENFARQQGSNVIDPKMDNIRKKGLALSEKLSGISPHSRTTLRKLLGDIIETVDDAAAHTPDRSEEHQIRKIIQSIVDAMPAMRPTLEVTAIEAPRILRLRIREIQEEKLRKNDKEPILIAIDGDKGVGKTFFSLYAARVLGAKILHLEDFVDQNLGPRKKDWSLFKEAVEELSNNGEQIVLVDGHHVLEAPNKFDIKMWIHADIPTKSGDILSKQQPYDIILNNNLAVRPTLVSKGDAVLPEGSKGIVSTHRYYSSNAIYEIWYRSYAPDTSKDTEEWFNTLWDLYFLENEGKLPPVSKTVKPEPFTEGYMIVVKNQPHSINLTFALFEPANDKPIVTGLVTVIAGARLAKNTHRYPNLGKFFESLKGKSIVILDPSVKNWDVAKINALKGRSLELQKQLIELASTHGVPNLANRTFVVGPSSGIIAEAMKEKRLELPGLIFTFGKKSIATLIHSNRNYIVKVPDQSVDLEQVLKRETVAPEANAEKNASILESSSKKEPKKTKLAHLQSKIVREMAGHPGVYYGVYKMAQAIYPEFNTIHTKERQKRIANTNYALLNLFAKKIFPRILLSRGNMYAINPTYLPEPGRFFEYADSPSGNGARLAPRLTFRGTIISISAAALFLTAGMYYALRQVDKPAAPILPVANQRQLMETLGQLQASAKMANRLRAQDIQMIRAVPSEREENEDFDSSMVEIKARTGSPLVKSQQIKVRFSENYIVADLNRLRMAIVGTEDVEHENFFSYLKYAPYAIIPLMIAMVGVAIYKLLLDSSSVWFSNAQEKKSRRMGSKIKDQLGIGKGEMKVDNLRERRTKDSGARLANVDSRLIEWSERFKDLIQDETDFAEDRVRLGNLYLDIQRAASHYEIRQMMEAHSEMHIFSAKDNPYGQSGNEHMVISMPLQPEDVLYSMAIYLLDRSEMEPVTPEEIGQLQKLIDVYNKETSPTFPLSIPSLFVGSLKVYFWRPGYPMNDYFIRLSHRVKYLPGDIGIDAVILSLFLHGTHLRHVDNDSDSDLQIIAENLKFLTDEFDSGSLKGFRKKKAEIALLNLSGFLIPFLSDYEKNKRDFTKMHPSIYVSKDLERKLRGLIFRNKERLVRLDKQYYRGSAVEWLPPVTESNQFALHDPASLGLFIGLYKNGVTGFEAAIRTHTGGEYHGAGPIDELLLNPSNPASLYQDSNFKKLAIAVSYYDRIKGANNIVRFKNALQGVDANWEDQMDWEPMMVTGTRLATDLPSIKNLLLSSVSSYRKNGAKEWRDQIGKALSSDPSEAVRLLNEAVTFLKDPKITPDARDVEGYDDYIGRGNARAAILFVLSRATENQNSPVQEALVDLLQKDVLQWSEERERRLNASYEAFFNDSSVWEGESKPHFISGPLGLDETHTLLEWILLYFRWESDVLDDERHPIWAGSKYDLVDELNRIGYVQGSAWSILTLLPKEAGVQDILSEFRRKETGARLTMDEEMFIQHEVERLRNIKPIIDVSELDAKLEQATRPYLALIQSFIEQSDHVNSKGHEIHDDVYLHPLSGWKLRKLKPEFGNKSDFELYRFQLEKPGAGGRSYASSFDVSVRNGRIFDFKVGTRIEKSWGPTSSEIFVPRRREIKVLMPGTPEWRYVSEPRLALHDIHTYFGERFYNSRVEMARKKIEQAELRLREVISAMEIGPEGSKDQFNYSPYTRFALASPIDLVDAIENFLPVTQQILLSPRNSVDLSAYNGFFPLDRTFLEPADPATDNEVGKGPAGSLTGARLANATQSDILPPSLKSRGTGYDATLFTVNDYHESQRSAERRLIQLLEQQNVRLKTQDPKNIQTSYGHDESQFSLLVEHVDDVVNSNGLTVFLTGGMYNFCVLAAFADLIYHAIMVHVPLHAVFVEDAILSWHTRRDRNKYVELLRHLALNSIAFHNGTVLSSHIPYPESGFALAVSFLENAEALREAYLNTDRQRLNLEVDSNRLMSPGLNRILFTISPGIKTRFKFLEMLLKAAGSDAELIRSVDNARLTGRILKKYRERLMFSSDPSKTLTAIAQDIIQRSRVRDASRSGARMASYFVPGTQGYIEIRFRSDDPEARSEGGYPFHFEVYMSGRKVSDLKIIFTEPKSEDDIRGLLDQTVQAIEFHTGSQRELFIHELIRRIKSVPFLAFRQWIDEAEHELDLIDDAFEKKDFAQVDSLTPRAESLVRRIEEMSNILDYDDGPEDFVRATELYDRFVARQKQVYFDSKLTRGMIREAALAVGIPDKFLKPVFYSTLEKIAAEWPVSERELIDILTREFKKLPEPEAKATMFAAQFRLVSEFDPRVRRRFLHAELVRLDKQIEDIYTQVVPNGRKDVELFYNSFRGNKTNRQMYTIRFIAMMSDAQFAHENKRMLLHTTFKRGTGEERKNQWSSATERIRSVADPAFRAKLDEYRQRLRELAAVNKIDPTHSVTGARLVTWRKMGDEAQFDANANTLINETDPEQKALRTAKLISSSDFVKNLIESERRKIPTLQNDTLLNIVNTVIWYADFGILSAFLVNMIAGTVSNASKAFHQVEKLIIETNSKHEYTYEDFLRFQLVSPSRSLTMGDLLAEHGLLETLTLEKFAFERNISFLYNRKTGEIGYVIGVDPEKQEVHTTAGRVQGYKSLDEMDYGWHLSVESDREKTRDYLGIHYSSDVQFLFNMHYHPGPVTMASDADMAYIYNFPYVPEVIANQFGEMVVYVAKLQEAPAFSEFNEATIDKYFSRMHIPNGARLAAVELPKYNSLQEYFESLKESTIVIIEPKNLDDFMANVAKSTDRAEKLAANVIALAKKHNVVLNKKQFVVVKSNGAIINAEGNKKISKPGLVLGLMKMIGSVKRPSYLLLPVIALTTADEIEAALSSKVLVKAPKFKEPVSVPTSVLRRIPQSVKDLGPQQSRIVTFLAANKGNYYTSYEIAAEIYPDFFAIEPNKRAVRTASLSMTLTSLANGRNPQIILQRDNTYAIDPDLDMSQLKLKTFESGARLATLGYISNHSTRLERADASRIFWYADRVYREACRIDRRPEFNNTVKNLLKEAETNFRDLLTIVPNHRMAVFRLAQIYDLMGQRKEALKYWNAYDHLSGKANVGARLAEVPQIVDLLQGQTVVQTRKDRMEMHDATMRELSRAHLIPSRFKNILIIASTEDEVKVIASHSPQATITAVNIDRTELETIQKFLASKPKIAPRVRLFLADAQSLDATYFPDDSFDFIYQSGLDYSAFENRNDADRILPLIAREEERVLQPYGYLFKVGYESDNQRLHAESLRNKDLFTVKHTSSLLFEKLKPYSSFLASTSSSGARLAERPIDESALRNYNPHEHENIHEPVMIGEIQDKSLFDGQGPGSEIDVNSMIIKMPGEENLLAPDQLQQFSEPMQKAFDRFKSEVPDWKQYYAKITVRRNWVPQETTQQSKSGQIKVGRVHTDGTQRGVDPSKRYPGDINYIVSNDVPTFVYRQPFKITDEDLLSGDVFRTMTEQADDSKGYTVKPYEIYELDPYVAHRADFAKQDTFRTFFRLRFTHKADTGDPNPLLSNDLDAQKKFGARLADRMDIRIKQARELYDQLKVLHLGNQRQAVLSAATSVERLISDENFEASYQKTGDLIQILSSLNEKAKTEQAKIGPKVFTDLRAISESLREDYYLSITGDLKKAVNERLLPSLSRAFFGPGKLFAETPSATFEDIRTGKFQVRALKGTAENSYVLQLIANTETPQGVSTRQILPGTSLHRLIVTAIGHTERRIFTGFATPNPKADLSKAIVNVILKVCSLESKTPGAVAPAVVQAPVQLHEPEKLPDELKVGDVIKKGDAPLAKIENITDHPTIAGRRLVEIQLLENTKLRPVIDGSGFTERYQFKSAKWQYSEKVVRLQQGRTGELLMNEDIDNVVIPRGQKVVLSFNAKESGARLAGFFHPLYEEVINILNDPKSILKDVSDVPQFQKLTLTAFDGTNYELLFYEHQSTSDFVWLIEPKTNGSPNSGIAVESKDDFGKADTLDKIIRAKLKNQKTPEQVDTQRELNALKKAAKMAKLSDADFDLIYDNGQPNFLVARDRVLQVIKTAETELTRKQELAELTILAERWGIPQEEVSLKNREEILARIKANQDERNRQLAVKSQLHRGIANTPAAANEVGEGSVTTQPGLRPARSLTGARLARGVLIHDARITQRLNHYQTLLLKRGFNFSETSFLIKIHPGVFSNYVTRHPEVIEQYNIQKGKFGFSYDEITKIRYEFDRQRAQLDESTDDTQGARLAAVLAPRLTVGTTVSVPVFEAPLVSFAPFQAPTIDVYDLVKGSNGNLQVRRNVYHPENRSKELLNDANYSRTDLENRVKDVRSQNSEVTKKAGEADQVIAGLREHLVTLASGQTGIIPVDVNAFFDEQGRLKAEDLSKILQILNQSLAFENLKGRSIQINFYGAHSHGEEINKRLRSLSSGNVTMEWKNEAIPVAAAENQKLMAVIYQEGYALDKRNEDILYLELEKGSGVSRVSAMPILVALSYDSSLNKENALKALPEFVRDAIQSVGFAAGALLIRMRPVPLLDATFFGQLLLRRMVEISA